LFVAIFVSPSLWLRRPPILASESLRRPSLSIDKHGPAIDNPGMPRIAILTSSDKGAAGERADTSGDLIAERCSAAGHSVVARAILPDDVDQIAAALRRWCDSRIADVVITTGGTGLTPRDVTPDATREVAERDVPGIPMALMVAGLQKTPYAALSRGIAVTRGRTLIVNLPGSPRAVGEGLDVLIPLIPHIGELLAGPHEHSGTAE
jgi:molybdopterin adenylyltransferase